MGNRMRCSLLCEDLEQERFFRPILERVFGGRITVEPRKPAGGAPFVMAQLPKLVKGIRQRHQEAAGLVVVVDGDTLGLPARLKEINEYLARANMEGLRNVDKVAVCVPCRNIETWCLWFCNVRTLNEIDDFKSRWGKETHKTREAANAWFAPSTPSEVDAEKNILPALSAARAELKRVLKLL
jgi:hypothetical protein